MAKINARLASVAVLSLLSWPTLASEQNCKVLKMFVVTQKLADGVYIIDRNAPLPGIGVCKDRLQSSCPYHYGPAVLRTLLSEFQDTGWVKELDVVERGTEDLVQANGFSKKVKVFVESPSCKLNWLADFSRRKYGIYSWIKDYHGDCIEQISSEHPAAYLNHKENRCKVLKEVKGTSLAVRCPNLPDITYYASESACGADKKPNSEPKKKGAMFSAYKWRLQEGVDTCCTDRKEYGAEDMANDLGIEKAFEQTKTRLILEEGGYLYFTTKEACLADPRAGVHVSQHGGEESKIKPHVCAK